MHTWQVLSHVLSDRQSRRGLLRIVGAGAAAIVASNRLSTPAAAGNDDKVQAEGTGTRPKLRLSR